MPKSRIRKKEKKYVPDKVAAAPPAPTESPRWLPPTMLTTFIIGLAWIVAYYISQTRYPIPNIGAWNMAIGFGLIGIGFGLATRWR